MNKFVLFAILLLASSAFAQRYYRLGQTQQLDLEDREDILQFAKGFLAGISEDALFDNIKACIGDAESFYKDVATAIADIKSKDPVRVKEGIVLLGQAAQIIPQAAQVCQAAQSEISKLIQLAQALSNPQSFFYAVSKSLLINHVEVIHEVTSAVKAYEKRDFYQLGYWVGKATDTILLGLNQPLRQGLVDFVNQNQNGWTAKINPKFANMSLAQIKSQYLGAIPSTVEDEVVFDYEGSSNDIPTYFNSSEQWPGCVHPIRDQGHCGSCWAFAASETLSDRFCIASKKEIDVILSPQDLVSCNWLNQGCNGGIPALSWRYLVNSGTVTDSCWPYESASGKAPKCKDFSKCHDGQPVKRYYAEKNSVVTLSNPTSIQNNILSYGPVEAAFNVYEDFMNYSSGIYKHTSGALLGGHAVKIIGWGKEGSVNYWIVANSWSTSWGINGFFKIAFGECGIDKSCMAGQADIKKARQDANPKWFAKF